MKRSLVIAAAAVLAFGIAACSSPTPTFYALRPSAAQAADARAAAAIIVVVGPVTVPEMVDRPQIVTINPDQTIAVNEFARWAAPLKSDIGRVIAADLGDRLGVEHISVVDPGAGTQEKWQVRVDIMHFDSIPGDSATIDAQWAVRPPERRSWVWGHTRARVPVASRDYGALVDAHDAALAAISGDIAAVIRANAAPPAGASK
ncbi:MAG TPA: PqiC family protein [Paraburkholderia sp.]|jgi:uncharacterized lipoprotein YmbA|nr:PqiC family protein [Paraburkholderia sp.]